MSSTLNSSSAAVRGSATGRACSTCPARAAAPASREAESVAVAGCAPGERKRLRFLWLLVSSRPLAYPGFTNSAVTGGVNRMKSYTEDVITMIHVVV